MKNKIYSKIMWKNIRTLLLMALVLAALSLNAFAKEVDVDFSKQSNLEEAFEEGTAELELSEADYGIMKIAAGSASDIVRVAKAQVGSSGVPNKFTRWLGMINNSYSYAWCHAFVSWCAAEAGCGSLVPRTASCATGVQWFQNQKQWKSRTSGYTPQSGDIIYFDWGPNGGYDHVGIVDYVASGRVHTIEGNANNAVKLDGGYANGYSLTDSQIIGYGTPAYSSKSNSPQGYVDIIEAKTGAIHVKGWAFDNDAPTQALEIHIYVGNSPYARIANQTRTDVGSKFPGTGNNHGFDYVIPVKESGSQKVSVYAINVGSGSNTLIEAGEKTINIPADTVKPVIKNTKLDNITKDGYTISCTVTDSVAVDKVQYAVWTTKNGQDDLQWYQAAKSGDTYTYRVNISKHSNQEGDYRTHIYAYDGAGNCSVVTLNDVYIDRTAPTISNIQVTNIDYTGYTVSCKVTDKSEIDRVQFPAWTSNAGQDDLVTDWVHSKSVSGTKSGDIYTFRVKTSEHKNESGKYYTHIYAYDKQGNSNAEGVIVNSVIVPAYVNVSGVSLNTSSLILNVGESKNLTATVSPVDATNKNITWTSSNKSVVTVDEKGKVTAVGGGSAVITVTTVANAKTATCKIQVNVKVTGVSLDKSSLSIRGIGTTAKLNATVAPSNATDKSVTWSSNNTSVATVNSTGVVTAQGSGSATITVKTTDGEKSASCTVSVIVPVTGIALNKTALELSEEHLTDTLIATITPSNATNKEITWSSTDTTIATVSSDGKVTGIKPGSATITATTKDGGKTASCNVTIVRQDLPSALCTFIYDANGGDQAPEKEQFEQGATVKISSEIPVRSGYQFVGWAESPHAQEAKYMPGDTVIVGENDIYVVLYALWRENIEGISLDRTQLNLSYIGQSEVLTAYSQPANRVLENVVWSSTHTDVASVNSLGIVVAKGSGTTVISAKTEDGAYLAECTVTVTVEVETIALNYANVEMYKKGETVQLEAYIYPQTATNKKLKWESSNQDVATVDESGMVTAVGNGTTDITVTAEDNGKSSVCHVKVNCEEVCEHVWGMYQTDREATCSEPGIEAIYCTICGTKQENSERSIPEKDHIYGQISTIIVSCEQPVLLEKTCTVCGFVNRSEGSVPGHKFVDDMILEEATCEHTGRLQRVCTVCNEKQEVELPKTEHSFSDWTITEDTQCTVDGKMQRTCLICGIIETDVMEAPGHIAGEWEVIKQATYEADGERIQRCEMCMEVIAREIIPKLESPITDEPETEESTMTGYVAGQQKNLPAGTMIQDKISGGVFNVAADGISLIYKNSVNKNKAAVIIPDTVDVNGVRYMVTSIAANAFKNNRKLSKVTIGENILTIGKNAFAGCKKLTVVSGGRNVRNIGNAAFRGCSKLKTINWSLNLNRIGKMAFYKCSALTKVTLPKNLRSIGRQAFSGCKKLKKVAIRTKSLTNKNVGSKIFESVPKNMKVQYPKGKRKAYKKLLGLK